MRLSEIYTSAQGEGPEAGWLTQFIRFAGCNLRCPGWPCDTQHAINPKLYRDEWQENTPEQVIARLDSYPKRVTLTGGEPFLQNTEDLRKLVGLLTERGYFIEVFTNGTLPFDNWVQQSNVGIIMDWKLPGSGEGAWKVDERLRNLGFLTKKDAVKFVCVNREDFLQAINTVSHQYPELFQYIGHWYVGAAWGKVTEAVVVEWMKQVNIPFKLNVQIHNYLWPRDTRRT